MFRKGVLYYYGYETITSLCGSGGLALLLVFAFCLVGGLSPAVASAKALPATAAPASAARTAHAGRATMASGAGLGATTPQVLSSAQQAQHEQMLQRVHLPLPTLPTEATAVKKVAPPAPTALAKTLGGQITPQASVFVGRSDLGVHTSSQIGVEGAKLSSSAK